MAAFGALNVGWLGVIIMLFGTVSLFNDASYQSILLQLVPQTLLIHANVRLEQSDAVARISGPTLAGVLIAWVGAPFALLVDAVGHLFSAIVNASIPNSPPTERAPDNDAGKQIMEGLRWVYGHRQLSTLALNTNAWFLFNAVVGTVMTPFALRALGFSAVTLGAVLSAAGIGALLGTSFSTRAAQHWGVGRAIAVARTLYVPSLVLIALAPLAHHNTFQATALVMVSSGRFLYGLAMGIEGPLEISFRQSVTPAQLQGRTNATMRSTNRGMLAIGAPLGGAIADTLGFHAAFWIAVAGMVMVAVWYRLSPMYHAQFAQQTGSGAQISIP